MVNTNGQNGEASKDGAVGIPDQDSLDMTHGTDRQLLRASFADGWGVDAEKLNQYRVALDVVLAGALKEATNENATYDQKRANRRQVTSIVRTMKSIATQVQEQEFVNLKNARLDRGDLTERVALSPEDRARISDLARRIDYVDDGQF